MECNDPSCNYSYDEDVKIKVCSYSGSCPFPGRVDCTDCEHLVDDYVSVLKCRLDRCIECY